MNIESFKGKRILVVAAHPDDEILGIGGTVHRLVKKYKCEAKAIILGEGLTARGSKEDSKNWDEELKKHRANISKAASLVGYSSTGIHDLPDNRFDSVDLLDIIKIVESEIDKFDPQIIFTHHSKDLNVDHRLTSEAVLTSCRPLPGEPSRTILFFETPSSTEWQLPEGPDFFMPNIFIPISEEDLKAKQDALLAYEGECKVYPHPRSTKGLEIFSRKWGTTVGHEMAEAFRLVRCIL